jgi:hypothetical protein
MLIHSMTKQDSLELIMRMRLGRLACSQAGQSYVIPHSFVCALVGRDPGVDGAANGASGFQGKTFPAGALTAAFFSPSPKKVFPFQLVPVIALAVDDRLA